MSPRSQASANKQREQAHGGATSSSNCTSDRNRGQSKDGPGSDLRPGRDVAVPDDPAGRELRDSCGKARRSRERASHTALIRRVNDPRLRARCRSRKSLQRSRPAHEEVACMPGPPLEGDVLHDLAAAPDQQVRGDAQVQPRWRKVRVAVGWQGIREQLVDPGSAELARGQADAVDHDEIRLDAGRTIVAIRRRFLAGPVRAAPRSGVDRVSVRPQQRSRGVCRRIALHDALKSLA